MSVSLRSKLFAVKGGSLDALDVAGQVLFSIELPSGITDARDLFPLLPDGAFFVPSKGVSVINPPNGFGRFRDALFDGQSGANPDYIPQKRSQSELQVASLFQQMQSLNQSLLAREAALAASRALSVSPDSSLLEEPLLEVPSEPS